MSLHIEQLRNLTDEQAREAATEHGTPVYVYSLAALDKQIGLIKQWQMPYGQTWRYAMKANPHPTILKRLYEQGIWIDASSGPEAEAAIDAGVKTEHIMLTSQQLPDNLTELLEQGVRFNACSLLQLETFCGLQPGGQVSVRINPGVGDGHNNRLTTGGANAAFGIWHEYTDRIKEITEQTGVTITQMHTHIGSGTSPEPWIETAKLNLELIENFPDATRLSLGGGFKYGRMSEERTLDIADTASHIAQLVEEYAQRSGRELHIEIEPGTYLAAPTASLITKVIDVKDTGLDGHRFAIVNSGMNDLLRPSMYGAQHPLVTVAADGGEREIDELVVAGHCCESSDVFTVEAGDPELLHPRRMQLPQVGDYIVVEGVGAYSAAMRPSSYNSFEPAKEVFI